MAIIVFIGYLAMKQGVGKALAIAVKASIGIVMGMGSGALIANFGKLLTALQNITGIRAGSIPIPQ